MSTATTLAASAVSLGAFGWLAMTDPKRRRAFGLPLDPEPRNTRAGWAVALLPGILLPFVSGGAGFVLWFGGVAVAAWALVAVPGKGGVLTARLDRWRLAALGWMSARGRGIRAWIGAAGEQSAAALPSASKRTDASGPAATGLATRVAELERKVMSLETEIAFLRHGARDAGGQHGINPGQDARVA